MIFSSIVLHAVTFSHVLHLDVLRRQIELKLKAKIEISLCMAIMQNHPLPSLLYTVLPYCVMYAWPTLMMSVSQEVKELMKELYFSILSRRKTSFVRNFRFIVHMVYIPILT